MEPEKARNNWKSILMISLYNTGTLETSLEEKGQPTLKTILWVAIKKDDNMTPRPKIPSYRILDDKIAAMTFNIDEWKELRGNCATGWQFNCSLCGGGLTPTRCSGCGNKFSDDGKRGGGYDPITPKMVKFLREHGFEFEQDPSILWKIKNEEYAKALKKYKEKENLAKSLKKNQK